MEVKKELDKILKNRKFLEIDNLIFQDFDLPEEMDWDSACEYCKKLKLLGFENWRLPTKEELEIAYENKDKFKNIEDGWYWSITENNKNSSDSWIVNFFYGNGEWDDKTGSYYAVCVEDL